MKLCLTVTNGGDEGSRTPVSAKSKDNHYTLIPSEGFIVDAGAPADKCPILDYRL